MTECSLCIRETGETLPRLKIEVAGRLLTCRESLTGSHDHRPDLALSESTHFGPGTFPGGGRFHGLLETAGGTHAASCFSACRAEVGFLHN